MRHRCFRKRLSASRVEQAGRHVGEKVSRTSRFDHVTRKIGYPPEAHLILSAFRLSPLPQTEGYRRELASFYAAPVVSVRTGSSPLMTRPRVGPGPTWPSRPSSSNPASPLQVPLPPPLPALRNITMMNAAVPRLPCAATPAQTSAHGAPSHSTLPSLPRLADKPSSPGGRRREKLHGVVRAA